MKQPRRIALALTAILSTSLSCLFAQDSSKALPEPVAKILGAPPPMSREALPVLVIGLEHVRLAIAPDVILRARPDLVVTLEDAAQLPFDLQNLPPLFLQVVTLDLKSGQPAAAFTLWRYAAGGLEELGAAPEFTFEVVSDGAAPRQWTLHAHLVAGPADRLSLYSIERDQQTTRVYLLHESFPGSDGCCPQAPIDLDVALGEKPGRSVAVYLGQIGSDGVIGSFVLMGCARIE